MGRATPWSGRRAPYTAALGAAVYGRRGRSARRAALLGVSVLALATVGVGPASAEGYRYWSLWTRADDGWVFATQGPSSLRPEDGDTVGFRFAVQENSADANPPRDTPRFADVCASTPAEPGRKRVVLSLDFGTTAHAPSQETPPAPRTVCAQVPRDASAADALGASAPPLRYDANGLLCAIAGYPRRGCGEQVAGERPARPEGSATADPEVEHASDGGDGGPSVGLTAAATAIALVGGAALWQARRRRG